MECGAAMALASVAAQALARKDHPGHKGKSNEFFDLSGLRAGVLVHA
jgi:hypothetical protein